MKTKTVDQITLSMTRFAKRLAKEGQSSMGLKIALWAEQIEKAIGKERRRVCEQITVLSRLVNDCRNEATRIKMMAKVKGQYGNQ